MALLRYVVIGGGIAGHRATMELRRLSPTSEITLISEEQVLPYDRPPLSKAFLSGDSEERDIRLDGADDYHAHGIRFLAGRQAVAIDRARRVVLLADGERIGYDRLLLATGSRPRRLPPSIAEPGTVAYLRTLADAVELRKMLSTRSKRLVIVGGGFIGLEVAAAARAFDCEVIVLERDARLAARSIPPAASTSLLGLHRTNGVEVRLNAQIDRILKRAEGGVAVNLCGENILADAVVAGVGVIPNEELAAEAGLATEDGIVVDAGCVSSDPRIFAAGEATSHPISPNGEVRRIESWRDAHDHGAAAAAAMVDGATGYNEVPWFWSDQYDWNLQCAGLPNDGVRFQVLGDIATDQWAVISVNEEDCVVGAVAANWGRVVSQVKKAIRQGLRLDDLKLPLPVRH